MTERTCAWRARGRATVGKIWRERAVYAVLDGAGTPRAAGRTRDVLRAYRRLWRARAEDGAVRLGVRRGWGRWCVVTALEVATPAPRESGRADALALVAQVAAQTTAAGRRRGRVRALALLACGGLGGAAARSLLGCYEGFFPDVEAGVAWSLHVRLGDRARVCLRSLDLRALTQEMVADADLWTLREAGGGRWPAGVHVFAAIGGGPGVRGPERHRGARRAAISHAQPR